MATIKPKRYQRLAKARIEGNWYFVTEYQILPEQGMLVDFEGQPLLIPKEDWYEIDPASLQNVEGLPRVHLEDIENHSSACFCPACRRLRRQLRRHHYSARERFELFMLGVFFGAVLAVCFWGLKTILSL